MSAIKYLLHSQDDLKAINKEFSNLGKEKSALISYNHQNYQNYKKKDYPPEMKKNNYPQISIYFASISSPYKGPKWP